jgi:hypothetical protein
MRGLLLTTVLGLAACGPQMSSEQALSRLNYECPFDSEWAKQNYMNCLDDHRALVNVARPAMEAEDHPNGNPNALSLDQMEDAWARSDARSDYNRLWQPHYGYSSGYNPIAPTTQLNW